MKSGIQGLILAFIGTLTIFALARKDIFKNNPISLSFLTEKTIDDIREDFCSKSSSDLNSFYKEKGPSYNFSPEEGSSFVRNIIRDFISDDPNNKQDIGIQEVKDYFSESPTYIFVLVIFCILAVLWLPYTCCICCKCCGCIPESCLKKPKCFVLICILFSAVVLINCFIGYSQNGSIVDGVFGLGCSILKVEQHLKDGDEYKKQKPYWIGLKGIINKLEETKNDINSLDSKANEIKDIKNQIDANEYFVNFTNLLKEEYNNRKEKKVVNPDPNSSDKNIIPNFILTIYGPPETQNTCLNNATLEINYFKNGIKDALDDIAGNMSEAKSTIDLTDINKIIDNLDSSISDIENSIIEKINDYYDNFDKFSSKSREYINVFFSINLVIVVIVGVALLLLLLCNKGLSILCLSWFAMYCFMLLTFFLAGVFGLIGSFTQEASSAVDYLSEHLNEIKNIDEQVREISEICLNGNGSLSKSSIVPKDFDLGSVDDIYSLDKYIADLSNLYEKDIDYEPYSMNYNGLIYDKILTTQEALTELNTVLEEVKKYIDFSQTGTYISGDSDEVKYDKWVINEVYCENYDYVNNKNLRNLVEVNGECLVITEWTREQIGNRYENINSNNGIIIKDEVLKYYDSIIGYMNSYQNIINDIKNANEVFKNEFKKIDFKKIINDTEKAVLDVVNPLIESYKDIVGSESIFEILNCNFLKRDVNKIIEELYNDFGKAFKDTSTLLLIISIFELCMTIAILFIMKGFKHQESKKI